MNDGTLIAAESAIATNHIYSQPIQDNIAAESEVAKRGSAVASSTISTSSSGDNEEQRSQIDVGKLKHFGFVCCCFFVFSEFLDGETIYAWFSDYFNWNDFFYSILFFFFTSLIFRFK